MRKILLAILAMAFVVTACGGEPPAPGLNDAKRSITVTSLPSGASVVIDGGGATAVTPHTFANVSGERHAVQFTLADYRPLVVDFAANAKDAQMEVTLQRVDPIIRDGENVPYGVATLSVRAHREGMDGEIVLLADRKAGDVAVGWACGDRDLSCTILRNGNLALAPVGLPISNAPEFQRTGRTTPIDLRVQTGRSYILALLRDHHVSTLVEVHADAAQTYPVTLRTAMDLFGEWRDMSSQNVAMVTVDPNRPSCGSPTLQEGDACLGTDLFFTDVVLSGSTISLTREHQVLSGSVRNNGERIDYSYGTPENPSERSGSLEKMNQ